MLFGALDWLEARWRGRRGANRARWLAVDYFEASPDDAAEWAEACQRV